MQVGGGVSPSNAKGYLAAGASHVIVTSYVFREGFLDQSRLADMVSTVGKERLVLDLSCRRREPEGPFFVVTDRWQAFTKLQLSQAALQVHVPSAQAPVCTQSLSLLRHWRACLLTGRAVFTACLLTGRAVFTF